MSDKKSELQFPVNEMRNILKEQDGFSKIEADGASFLCGVLQFMTNKVLTTAIKSLNDDHVIFNQRKRDNNEIINSNENIEPKLKKRKLCPKDITKALKTDKELNEWAKLIQIPLNNDEDINDKDPLNRKIIAFDGDYGVGKTKYCKQVTNELIKQYNKYLNDNEMDKSLECIHLLESNSEVLINDVVKAFKNINKCKDDGNCLSWLYYMSTQVTTILNTCQHLLNPIQSTIDSSKIITTDRSPISCFSMAMFLKQLKLLDNNQLKLYLNVFKDLFNKATKPDIIVYIYDNNSTNTSIFKHNNELQLKYLRFQFEIIIKELATTKENGSQYIFIKKDYNINNLIEKLINIHAIKLPKIYWDPSLSNIIDKNKICHKKRIFYINENQISKSVSLFNSNIESTNHMSISDIIYININLWMKPSEYKFINLVFNHLIRQENICFFNNKDIPLNKRSKQILKWIFSN